MHFDTGLGEILYVHTVFNIQCNSMIEGEIILNTLSLSISTLLIFFFYFRKCCQVQTLGLSIFNVIALIRLFCEPIKLM